MIPKTTEFHRKLRAPANWSVICLGVLLVCPAIARQDDKVVVVPPVMVATEGGGPRYETIPELKAAAATGDALACFQYAQLLEVGDQVAKDPSAAFGFYQQAAFKGHPESLFRVAKAYHEGQLRQPENHALAFEYYQKAAFLNHPEGTYNVGAMLVSGRGIKRDYREGLAWLLLAAELGVDPGSIDQVKERLIRGKRPEWITDAENRLGGLKTEIAMGPPEAETEDALAPEIVKPAAPVMAPSPVMKPSIGAPSLPGFSPTVSGPSIAPPTISIPQPKPKPVEPTTPETE